MIQVGDNVYVVETRANLNRSISEPLVENSVRGSKDYEKYWIN